MKLCHGTMLYKLCVGHAEAYYLRMIAVVVHPFQYSRAKPAVLYTIFHCYYTLEFLCHLLKYCLIDRLEESHVVHCTRTFFCCQQSFVADRTDGKHCHIISVTHLTTGTYLYLLQRTTPVEKDSTSSGVTDYKCPLVRQLRCIHESSQFMFIHR